MSPSKSSPRSQVTLGNALVREALLRSAGAWPRRRKAAAWPRALKKGSLGIWAVPFLLGLAGSLCAAANATAELVPRAGVVLHVSPSGTADGDGSEAKPYATLEQARDRMFEINRQTGILDGGLTVLVHGGKYIVRNTFVLGPEHSSSFEKVPIVYRAADGEAPVFCGGASLKDFVPVTDSAVLARLPEEARGRAMQCDLKAQGAEVPQGPLMLGGMGSGNGFKTHPVPELFFNGEPMTMARWPNEDMMHVMDTCVQDGHQVIGIPGSKVGRFVYEGDRPARWKDEKDALLYGYWFFDWADSYERIAGIDTDKHEITLAEPPHTYGYRKGARYYAVNLLSEMDQTGEWYLDRANSLLYFLPPSDPANAEVTLSLFAEPLLRMEGTARVQFEGLTWELASGDAIQVKDGTDCRFAGCIVRRCGGNGITITGGRNCGVLSCDIYSMGRGGTLITGGDRKTLTPGGHFVENCHIHHLSRIDHTYTPAAVVDGVGNRVAHNYMHDINSSAMRVNGNDHTVEYNEVCNVLLESDDQGGADLWGDPTYRGNVFRYNYWHHIGNWRRTGEDLSCGQAGIRLDDAISGVLIQGNIFYHCSAGKAGFGGVQIHGGKDNLLENNIFADCEQAVSFSPWGEKRWEAFTGKSMESPKIDADLYVKRYPELAKLNENVDVNTLRRNIVWKCGKFMLRDKGTNIQEGNILDPADESFANPEAGDFTVKPDAPAVKDAGFVPIPFDNIGLCKSAFRSVLPESEIQAARAQR